MAKKAFKAWLWLLFVLNILTILGDAISVFMNFSFNVMVVLMMNTLQFIGVLLLLFAEKHFGFVVICFSSISSLIYNVIIFVIVMKELTTLDFYMAIGQIIINCFFVPVVTYFLMKKANQKKA